MSEQPDKSPRDDAAAGPLRTGVDHGVEKHDVQAMHAPIMREQIEPRDGFEPVPLWLTIFFGAVLFWGGWYLASYHGGWRSDVLDPDPAARFVNVSAGAAQPLDPVQLGQRLYTANCVSCHQAQGQGVPGQYPPLAQSSWVQGPPGRLARILLHGMEGPITVNGAAYNGNMPHFGQRLKDEQIAAVLTFIRQAFGNQAAAVEPTVVAAARAATRDRSKPWRAEELLAIEAPDVPLE